MELKLEHTTETRRESYERIIPSLSARRRLVLQVLGNKQMTAGEIVDELVSAGYLDYYDRNFVSPRLTELKKVGLVETVGKRTDKRTGRPQAVWARVQE